MASASLCNLHSTRAVKEGGGGSGGGQFPSKKQNKFDTSNYYFIFVAMNEKFTTLSQSGAGMKGNKS